VLVIDMPKPKADEPAPDPEPGGEKEKESTLKVTEEDASLVGKIAAHRKKSVKELFKMPDVREFFTHLLLEEMRQETERLKRRRS
jgi:hypothetical protein